MKKILSIAIFALLLTFSANCGGGNVYTADQCEKSLNTLFDKIAEQSSEEDQAKFAPMKATLMGKLKKECMSGKFDLECLENANNIAAMQTCIAE